MNSSERVAQPFMTAAYAALSGQHLESRGRVCRWNPDPAHRGHALVTLRFSGGILPVASAQSGVRTLWGVLTVCSCGAWERREERRHVQYGYGAGPAFTRPYAASGRFA